MTSSNNTAQPSTRDTEASTAEASQIKAISKQLDYEQLEKLRTSLNDAEKKLAQNINEQQIRLLSGNLKSDLSEAFRLEKISDVINSKSRNDILLIARLAKCKAAANTVMEEIQNPNELAQLCKTAVSINVRKPAAQRLIALNATEQIKIVYNEIENKDKTLSKLFQAYLDEISKNPTASITPVTSPQETVTDKDIEKPAELPPTQKAADKTQVSKAPAPQKSPEQYSQELDLAIESASYKSTPDSFACKGLLNGLRRSAAANEEWIEKIADYEARIEALLEKNREFQTSLSQRTEKEISELKTLLEQGESQKALRLWDRIQSSVNNLNGKNQAYLQSLTGALKAQLNELKDWKNFASAEKKKEVIEVMRKLGESTVSPAEKAKKIRSLHDDWKKLGHSSDNETLWQEFKSLSDAAYEVCKKHFKERKKVLAENFRQRKQLCQNLEAELENISIQDLTINQLSNLINTNESEWKKHAPVEQSKIKPLQKSFYGLINKLRDQRREISRSNAKEKQALIEKASELTQLEDNREAMNQAKLLQQQWKTLGPTTHNEDQKYWQKFRMHCDAIFEKRNQQAAKQRDELQGLEEEIRQSINNLETHFQLSDEDFRAGRGAFQDLQQQFNAALDPRIKKQRSKYLDQFNGVKRRIEMRYKQLPDKRQLKLLENMQDVVDVCLVAERKLFDCDSDADIAIVNPVISEDAWAQLTLPADTELAECLVQRRKNLNSVHTLNELNQLMAEQEEKQRTSCIEVEIRAGIDSPKEDNAKRMQLQLLQLKLGFGKSKSSREEDLKVCQRAKLLLACAGPLSLDFRDEMQERITQAVNKLSS